MKKEKTIKVLGFKGTPEEVCKQTEKVLRDYTPICKMKGIKPTVANVAMLKKAGW